MRSQCFILQISFLFFPFSHILVLYVTGVREKIKIKSGGRKLFLTSHWKKGYLLTRKEVSCYFSFLIYSC